MKSSEKVAFDSYVDDGGYSPEFYDFHEIDEGIESLDALTDEDVQRFHDRGYLAIKDALTPSEVRDAYEGLLDLIEGKNPEFKGVQFETAYRDTLDTLSREERLDAVRKLNHFVGFDDRLDVLSEHPGIRSAVGRIIGAEVELFSHQAILKPPRKGREKPWHQDHAYFNVPMGTPVVSAWVALDEATPENGCMRVIPGTHLKGPVVHFKRRDWQICDTDVVRNHVVAVALKPGGVLLWSGLIHHGTPENTTDRPRRAIQLHFVPAGVGRTTSEERLAVFGSEGKDVTC